MTVMVMNAAYYQGRCDSRTNSPPPSMTMRFRTLGGAHHDHQRERRSSDECW